MAKLVLSVPDGDGCENCSFRRRRTDVKEESYHCAIFESRADDKKTRECIINSSADDIFETI